MMNCMLSRKLPQIPFGTRQERKQEKGVGEGGIPLRVLGLESIFLFHAPLTSLSFHLLHPGNLVFYEVPRSTYFWELPRNISKCHKSFPADPGGSLKTGTLFFNRSLLTILPLGWGG